MIAGIAIIGLVVIARLFSLQIIDHTLYKDRAERQYVTPTGNIFDRGNIYFTSKDKSTVAAATVATGFKVAIVPSKITDPEKTYAALNAIVPIDKVAFLAKAQKKADPYEEVADKVVDRVATQITALHVSGVTLYREKWRLYPGGALASKAIGFKRHFSRYNVYT